MKKNCTVTGGRSWPKLLRECLDSSSTQTLSRNFLHAKSHFSGTVQLRSLARGCARCWKAPPTRGPLLLARPLWPPTKMSGKPTPFRDSGAAANQKRKDPRLQVGPPCFLPGKFRGSQNQLGRG